MGWLLPKVNWQPTDWINVADYNRWINNLGVLQELAHQLYIVRGIDLGEHQSYENYPYEDMLNTIEQALDKVNKGTFNFDIGDVKVYSANNPYFDYNEINRIESASLELYTHLSIELNMCWHYAQNFNGASIYKVPRIKQTPGTDPIAYRLMFRLGDRKGVIK
jgi:hypothetical protein